MSDVSTPGRLLPEFFLKRGCNASIAANRQAAAISSCTNNGSTILRRAAVEVLAR